MNERTTIYTCTNEKYYDFIPIFIHSNLFHNENVDIEIGVENNRIDKSILKIFDICSKIYSNSKINLKIVPFNHIFLNNTFYPLIPNIIRFIETPTIKNKYVYISDIDIITLQENFTSLHINDMNINDLNYSNIVRKNTSDKRLTGLHFSKWDNYYPIPDFSDLFLEKYYNSDEVFLYNLVNKKNKICENNTYRPVHGIHVSPNRNPKGNPGWNINAWAENWNKYRKSDEFILIEKLFTKKLKHIIEIIDKETII